MFEELLNLNANFTSIVRKTSKKYNITLPQALILFHISIRGSSMSGLAARLGLDPSTITRNIGKLEFKNLLYKKNCLTPSAAIVKRNILEKVGGFSEDIAFITSEDFDLWLKISRVNAKIVFLILPN